jgi:hypothetical protein
MTKKEIKSLIGAAAYARIEAFARKARKAGMEPAEVKKALKAKFGKHLKTVNSELILSSITGGGH